MTVKDVLSADLNVDNIDVTVRASNSQFIASYRIGRDVRPSKYHRFQYDTAVGSVYHLDGLKYLYIEKEIQFHEADVPYKGTKGFGVVLEEIPKELLALEVSLLTPTKSINRGSYHGYKFVCYSDLWMGISGEDEIIEQEQTNDQRRSDYPVRTDF